MTDQRTPEGQPKPPLDGTTYQEDHTALADYLILYDEAGVVIDVVHEISPGEDCTIWFTAQLPRVSKVEFKRGKP